MQFVTYLILLYLNCKFMYNYVINKHINKNCVSYFMDRLVSKHSNLHNFVIICTAKFRPYFVQK